MNIETIYGTIYEGVHADANYWRAFGTGCPW